MRLPRTITDTSMWSLIIDEGLETHGEGRIFHKHRDSRAKMEFKFPVSPKQNLALTHLYHPRKSHYEPETMLTWNHLTDPAVC